jgi:hypothetical protein
MAMLMHRNGIPWWEAPLPRRLHRCTPWTTGSLEQLTILTIPARTAVVSRCACGAVRVAGDHRWQQRNERRWRR